MCKYLLSVYYYYYGDIVIIACEEEGHHVRHRVTPGYCQLVEVGDFHGGSVG